MAIDDQSRGRRTYSYFRTQPRAAASTLLIGGTNVTITGDQNGITISATGGGAVSGSNPGLWTDGGGKIRTTGSVALDSSGRYAPNVGTDVYLFVSGSIGVAAGTNRNVTVFGGDVVVSGSINGAVALSSSNIPLGIDSFGIAGTQQTDQTQFTSIGSFEFAFSGADSMAPPLSTTYQAYFESLVETTNSLCVAEIRLYNVSTAAIVTNSMQYMSGTSLTRLKTGNLTGSFATGLNLYDVQLRLTTASVGVAICKSAKLRVYWS